MKVTENKAMTNKRKEKSIQYKLLTACVLLVLCLLNRSLFAAETVTNYQSGISISFGGTAGSDWTQEYFYHNPAVDDHRVIYIKDATKISFAHNERNMRQKNTSDRWIYDIGVNGQDGIANSGDEGAIRYRVDRDWQILYNWSLVAANDTSPKYPAFTAPFSFSELQYEAGVPVVGTTGYNGANLTDIAARYWRGILDDFSDEWHTIAFADDDQFIYQNPDGPWSSHWEKLASDGKVLLFVVNPKTPCIRFETTGSGQFYTTPPKAYWIPKVHTQTTYLTDNVSIVLTNIMNSQSCYYRFYTGTPSGSFTQFSTAAMAQSVAGLQNNTTYTLEYYYNSSYKKIRYIVKNPTYPSAAESHGNTLWQDNDELNQIRQRLTGGNYKTWYNNYMKKNGIGAGDRNGHNAWDTYGGKGYRISADKTFVNAFIALIDGWNYKCGTDTKPCSIYGKEMLLESVLNLDPLWFGDPVLTPDPCPEYLYRGYYDASPVVSNALAYDILIANFRADQQAGGITAIEDYKIRDSLAKWCMECMMMNGQFGQAGHPGMWGTSRSMAALVIALTMPSYNTKYYGTSGFDGQSATYPWTPYRDYPVTWKDAFFAETNTLHEFPNQVNRYDTDRCGNLYNPLVLEQDTTYSTLTLGSGNFSNRAPYASYLNMGWLFEVVANVAKVKLNHTYTHWEAMFNRISDGTFKGLQGGETYTGPLLLLINERFKDNNIAAKAEAFIAQYPTGANSVWSQMSYNGVYSLILYHEDWRTIAQVTNHAPAAGADTYTVQYNSTENISSVLTNDSDPDFDAITITSVSVPGHGHAYIVQNNTKIDYVPDSGYSGSDQFTYTISDNKGGFANAAVTITVQSGNHNPTAQNDTFTIQNDGSSRDLDVLINDSDSDNDTISITSTSAASHGQISISLDNSQLVYFPATGYTGTDSFTYTISDGKGGTAQAAVTITVNPGQGVVPVGAVYTGLDELSLNNTYKTISTSGWSLSGTTICFWTKPANLTGTRYLFGHSFGTWSSLIQLYLENGVLGVGMGSDHALKTNLATLQTGQWYFIALSWNGSTYSVYVNNQLAGTGSYTGLAQLNTTADLGSTGTTLFRTTQAYIGIIDDVRVYSYSLSSSEVSQLFDYKRNAGLTAHLLLDEYTGSAAADCTGLNSAAKLFNSPDWGLGWAQEDFIRLTNKTQGIEIPVSALDAKSGSIAIWITPSNLSGTQFLVGHQYSSSNRIYLYSVAGSLTVGLGSSGLLKSSIAQLQTGQTYHVVLAWNGSEYTVSLDGRQLDSGNYSGLAQLSSSADIGNYGDTGNRTLGFLGTIDDVRIYSRALTLQEIRSLYSTHDIKQNKRIDVAVHAVDNNGNSIPYQPVNLPAGATFDSSTKTIHWQPWYNQAGDYAVRFTAPGQADQNVTLTVHQTQLAEWYRNFLIYSGKL